MIFSRGYAQQSNFIESEIPIRDVYSSWDGLYFQSNGTYKILNIFVNIEYDLTPQFDPLPGPNSIWSPAMAPSINQNLPTYLLDMMDTASVPGIIHGAMTRKYWESSLGNLYLMGDFVVVDIKQSDIACSNPASGFLDHELFSSVVDQINSSGGLTTVYTPVDFSDYDKDGDDKFDVVQFFTRNTTKRYGELETGGQSSSVSSYSILVNGQYKMTMAYTAQIAGVSNLGTNFNQIYIHEFSHGLFGSNEAHTSGGHGWDYSAGTLFLGTQGGYGLMGGSNSGMVSCNGYERWRMHWIDENFNSTGEYIAANNQPSDIKKSDGDKTFILRDFVTTGDAVRILLPYKDDGALNQYIWLENHKIGLNDKLDFFYYSNTNTCRSQGKPGIFAYYQVGKDVLSSSNYNIVYPSGYADNLKMISARGNFDYVRNPNFTTFCVAWNQSQPYFTETKENTFLGSNTLTRTGFDEVTNIINSTDSFVFPWKLTRLNNSTTDSLPFLMQDNDAFRGNGWINIGSNPAPFNTLTYNNYVPRESTVISKVNYAIDNRTIYLSGLSIHYQRLPNDDYQVTVSWDDYTVDQDRTWCGNIVVNEKVIVAPEKVLTVDVSNTANMLYRNTVTGQFSDPTLMTFNDESEFIIGKGSSVNTINHSKILLKTGSVTTIEDLASLLVNNTASLEIEECATLIIKGDAKLEVFAGGSLIVHEGARIYIDGPDNIVLHSGFLTGNGLPLTLSNYYTLLGTPTSIVLPVGTTTWSNPTYYVNGKMTIPTGSTLIVNESTVEFTNDSKVVIDRGGKLVLNGATFTNSSCGLNLLPWLGIEVNGDSEQGQNASAQGVLELNSSLIENAICAVKTYKPDPTMDLDPLDPQYNGLDGWNGGIVTAHNTIFRNNKNAVVFPGYKLGSASTFTLCTFETTEALLNGAIPDYFVRMKNIAGVQFFGCIFRNTMSDPTILPENLGGGIYAYDATVVVSPKCQDLNCTAFTRGSFRNLYYGIRDLSAGESRTTYVDRQDFIDNFRGVYFAGRNYVEFTRNYIRPYSEQSSQNPQTYGVYFDQCTGYHIEDNTFDSENSTKVGIGLIVNKSGSQANEVYRNNFNNLRYASIAQSYNRGSNNEGLCYKCNNFVNNLYDVKISRDNAVFLNISDGIAAYQGRNVPGNNQAPAGNLFSDIPNGGSFSFHNSANGIYYFKHQNPNWLYQLYPDNCAGTGSVNVMTVLSTTKNSSSCPSKLDLGDNSNEDIEKMAEASSEASALKDVLTTLVDGGNTDNLAMTVSTSNASQSTELRNELIATSPYLTDTVLSLSIDQEEALPNSMLRDVFVANPQSAKSNELLEKLENRGTALSNEMWNEILAGAAVTGEKENKEAEYSAWKNEEYYRWGRINRRMLLNQTSTDSIINVLQSTNLLEARVNLALYYLASGNSNQAILLIDSTLLSPEVESGDRVELEALRSYVQEMSISYPVADTSMTSNLLTTMEESNGVAEVLSRNALVQSGVLNYSEPILVDDGLKSTTTKRFGLKPVAGAEVNEILVVYPNPATDYLTVVVNQLKGNGKLSLSSSNGVVVLEREVNNEATCNVDVSGLPSGIYILSLIENGSMKATTKVTLQ